MPIPPASLTIYPMLKILQLMAMEGERWRVIRLASLKEAPDAFGSTFADASGRQAEGWSNQIVETAIFVAVIDGMDVGVARGAPNLERQDEAFLISMWVAPEFRGHRVGGALIDAIIAWARAQGYVKLILDVADTNDSAIALYARKGFKPTGESGTLPPPREHIGEHRRALKLL